MGETDLGLKQKRHEKPRRMAEMLDQNTMGMLALRKGIVPYRPEKSGTGLGKNEEEDEIRDSRMCGLAPG